MYGVNWFSVPTLLLGLFELWMCVDAIRRREWFWAVFIWLFPGIMRSRLFSRVSRRGPRRRAGFELPGAQSRQRIKELQAQIHHLDKAHHYFQLGDIYFRQGKLTLAEAAYRFLAAGPGWDIDARAPWTMSAAPKKTRGVGRRRYWKSLRGESQA